MGKKGTYLRPAPVLAQHCAAWPAQLASPAHLSPLPCRLPPLARRTKGVCPTRGCTCRPPPACLLAAERLWETPRIP